MKRGILRLLLITGVFSASAMAQINCASGTTASTKLICEFPFSTGALTNDTALGTGSNSASATASAQAVAAGLNIAMASQVTQLPIASASAGTVVVFKGGVPETFNNLGPILTDRGQTIGRGRVFIGFSASQFVFNNIDNKPLGNLPFAYSRPAYNGSGNLQSTTYTTEGINLSFKLNQYVGIATVGVSKRIDVSAIIPYERVSLGATTSSSTNYVVDASNAYLFSYNLPPITSSGTANGIGDAIANVKAMLPSGERASFAAELNVRIPSGDDQNFLGSGAWGINPYLVYSYLAKFSPHAKIGYQWNTKTELTNLTSTAGTTTSAGAEKVLPGGLIYDIGADYAVAKRMTLAADLLGSQFLNTPTVSIVNVALTGVPSSVLQGQSPQTSTSVSTSYTVNNVSAGLKISPVGRLVLDGNVLIQINNNGLHSRPTPLVGISYKF